MKYTDVYKMFNKKAEEAAEPEDEEITTEAEETAETNDDKTDDANNTIIDMLRKILADEYVSYYAYFSGAKNIRGENWMDVKQEFEQHAEDERGHFEAVFDRLYKLGYYCKDKLDSIKENAGYYWDVDTMEPKKAAEIAKEAEKKAVEAYEKLLAYISAQEPGKRDYATEKLAKDHLETEQDHLQDMERLVEEF